MSARKAALWIRRNLLEPWWNGLLTLAALFLAVMAAWSLIRWAIVDAAFGTTPASCEGIEGACWSFIADTFSLFLVGTYPQPERWRPFLCLGGLLALLAATAVPACRRRPALWLAWAALPFAWLALLAGGGWLGLRPVESAAWGGLILTLVLSLVGIALAFPLGVLLALGRRARRMHGVRLLCVAFIEGIRGVPLISILFLAAVVVPLFLPSGVTVDNLIRAQIGIVLFQSAYLAEVVRGGLQAVPSGQEEAAQALGLTYPRLMALVVLPQALRIVIPALVNQFIIILKDTSLVAVIGMFDLLGIAEVSMRAPKWLGKTFEGYAFVAAIYWTMCFAMSRVALRLESRLKSRQV